MQPSQCQTLRGTRATIINLAMLYKDQGRHAKAEPLHLEALQGQRAVLGERHPDILSSSNNLAALYSKRDNFLALEALHREGLLTIFTHKCGERFVGDWKIGLKRCLDVIATRGPNEN